MSPKKTGTDIVQARISRFSLIAAGIGVFILAISFGLNQQFERVEAWNLFGGQSNGFSGRGIEDEFRAPRQGEYVRTPLPLAVGVRAPEGEPLLRVAFLYRIHPDTASLWLTMVRSNLESITLLVHHDFLESQPMPHISDGTVSLFQKQITHDSIGAFLASKAYETSETWSEEFIIDLWSPLSPFAHLVETVEVLPESAEYVLTTWLRPRIFPNGWLEFSRTLDLTDAAYDEDGNLVFELFSRYARSMD
jgi:hypothetical protein